MAATNIAQEISRLTAAKADIKTAIEGKGVTVPSTTKLDGYADLVGQIQQGGGAEEAPENDVNFYDYDGFRVASFSIAEAKALTQAEYDAILPPAHEGLTFQEWNWTLNDIATYNRQYADIGANYITTDGKTHIKGTVTDTNPVSVTLIGTIVSITVDWGDQTQADTHTFGRSADTVVLTHTYAHIGEYDIQISADDTNGYFSPYRKKDNAWTSNFIITEVNCGNKSALYGDNALSFIPHLKLSIATSTYIHLTQAFYCSTVALLAIPKGTTSFVRQNAFQYTDARLCMPKEVPNFSGAVFNNSVIKKMIFPVDQGAATYGQYSLQNCKYTNIISLPLSFKFSGALFQFASMSSLIVLEIETGWIPQADMNLSETNMNTTTIVDFFSKLGTTQTVITLTLGTRLLALLNSSQKAIATDKGYTLA